MVLSSNSDHWGTDIVQNVNSEPIYQTKPVESQLVAGDVDDYDQHLQFNYYDTFEVQHYAFLDPFLPHDPSISLSPENEINIPYENFSPYQYPKRKKLIEDQSMQGMNLEGIRNVGNCKKNMSVQSIAARERRRKISEKTQELGKLVPGGNKMNTAEMLRAAFKYIKYMQAQLGILQVMENVDSKLENNMQILVTSPKVQEKLYMEDKCLVFDITFETSTL